MLADLEQTWYCEVEEVANGKMDMNEASFYGYLQLEVRLITRRQRPAADVCLMVCLFVVISEEF